MSGRLRCIIVGCGKVARKHLKAIGHHPLDLELAGLVDSRPELAGQLLQSAGFSSQAAAAVPVFARLDDCLAAVQPDLAAITTPSGTHDELAMTALQSGVHVLVEKPLTLSLAQADALLEAAAERHLIVAVGHIYRFFPIVQALEADLRRGTFGRILYGDVKVRWGHDQAYYDQAAWRGTWAQDGGALMNQSIHALDLMTWLLGGRVTEVSGWIDRQTHDMEAEDLGLAMLRLDNGTYCLLEGTTSTDPDHPEAVFTLECSNGEIRAGLRDGKPYFSVLDRSGHKRTGRYIRRQMKQTWKQGGLNAFKQLGNPHSGLYRDLVRAIRTGQPPLADGRSGRDAVELVLAIYASALHKKPVKLPLTNFTLMDMADYFPQPKRKKG